MNLKLKMMISASLLTALPVIIAVLTIGSMASTDSKKALEVAAEARVIATRDITKSRIEDYFGTIHKQVFTLSHDPTIITAAKDFTKSFTEYKTSSPTPLTKAKAELLDYYQTVFLPEYRSQNSNKSIDAAEWIAALDADSIALQHRFIAQNKNPLGEKDKLTNLGNVSTYNVQHKKYHPILKEFLGEFGYYDIFIVDSESGDIVYSVFKELDFSTSLKTGTFASSGIGKVFQQSLLSSGEPSIVDFEPYAPSYEAPASFIAAPIYDKGKKIAVLIFQMPVDAINNIMTYNKNWQSSGLGQSGESYLVGADKKSRTLSRFLIEDKTAYIEILRQQNVEAEIIGAIDSKNTNIGLQSILTPGVEKSLQGNAGFEIFADYRGVNVLSAYSPVSIQGLNWVIMTEIDEAEAFESANKLAERINNTSVWVTLILLSSGLFIGILFANKMTNPIIGFSKLLQRIETESDLTIRSSFQSNDEIGAAAVALNQMLIKFHDSVKEVADSAEQIATTTEETSVISSETQVNIEEQQVATELVATATHELTMTVQEVTKNISLTAEAADKAYKETITGDEVLKSTISDITGFANEISLAADSIRQLEIDTANISQVVDVIKSIADQTNLLALNAAIEAARAGEQGRGFAVVADEVRTLAGRTQESTEEINQMVEQLQSSARNSVVLINNNKDQIQQVVKHAKEAGDSLTNISGSVDEINQMSTQIAVAAEEQVSVTESVNQNLLQITAIAERTAEGSKKTNLASEDLAKLAVRMSTLVKQFKTD